MNGTFMRSVICSAGALLFILCEGSWSTDSKAIVVYVVVWLHGWGVYGG